MASRPAFRGPPKSTRNQDTLSNFAGEPFPHAVKRVAPVVVVSVSQCIFLASHWICSGHLGGHAFVG